MANLAKSNGIAEWLKHNFYTKKFNTPAGYVVMALVGIAIAYLGAFVDSRLPVLIAFGMLGLLVLIVIFYQPLTGFYITLLGSACVFYPDRLTTAHIPVPLGIMIEVMGYLTMLSIVAQQYRKRSSVSAFWRNPLTIMFLVLLAYYIIDIFNPVYHNPLGWLSYLKKQISYFVFYYISYMVLDSYDRIVQFFKVWLIMSVLIALYAIKQQWFGMAQFELDWLHRNPEVWALSFQAGFLRKSSILGDPASFGVFCASMAIFCLVVALRVDSKKRRYQFLLATVAFLLGSSYSGTRSSNLMIVAGILAYGIFTLNEKRTYTILTVLLLGGLFLIFGPFKNNPVVYRISSTFEGNKDPSAMVRSINRHRVQPYLNQHPMGGGIFTSGFEGEMYNEGHYLSKFPPDSGYMKILAEEGWIGLLLTIIFYFITLRMGLRGYFHCVNKNIKTLYLATTVCILTLLVGQYSQMALNSYPEILFYFTAIIILYKLKDYDTITPETTTNTKEPA